MKIEKEMKTFYRVFGYNELGGGYDDQGNFYLGMTEDLDQAYAWCEEFVDNYPSTRSTSIHHWRAPTSESIERGIKSGRFSGAFYVGKV